MTQENRHIRSAVVYDWVELFYGTLSTLLHDTGRHLYQTWDLVSRGWDGNDVAEAKKKKKHINNQNVAIQSWMCYIYVIVFFVRVFALFCTKTYHFLWFFLLSSYVKKLSISISFFSRFYAFSYTSHTFHKNTNLAFGVTAAGVYHQLRIKWCFML